MNCCRKTFRSAGNSLGLPALLLSLGVFFVDHANAQTIVPLDCEETVTGTFGTNPFEQKHIYSFQGDAGERLLISWAVTFPSKTHRLIVEVLDPQNQKLSFQGGITNPDDGINSDRTTLPVSGSYRLEVSNSFIHQNGVSYFLSLQSFSGGCAASLTCGGSVTGQITQVTQIDTVTFSGVAGQAVALRTEATSGPLQLRAYLIDEAGEFVGINFTQFDELKFVFPLEGNLRKPGKPLVLPSTGTYVVTIADNEDYDGASPNAHRPGDYEVSLTCDCTYSASPVTLSFPAGGGTSQVDVNVTDGCNWKVGGGSSFTSFSNNLLEIANILYGVGDLSVGVTAFANFPTSPQTSTQPRSATLNLAGTDIVVNQDGLQCDYTISPQSEAFPAGGGPGTIQVSTAPGCWWDIVQNPPRITFEGPSTKPGPQVLHYTLEENPLAQPRTIQIMVAGHPFLIEQDGVGCSYSLSPAGSLPLRWGGGDIGTFSVATQPGCHWVAIPDQPWIVTTDRGKGNGVVTFLATANPGGGPRHDVIYIEDKTFRVTQDGETTPCTYQVTPANLSFPAAGGSGTVSVNTPGGCCWPVASNQDWLVPELPIGCSQNPLNFQVAASSSTSARTAQIMISDQVVTVTQAGTLDEPGCSYTLSPTSQSFTAVGGSGTVQVEAPDGCSWSASTGNSWIQITGPAGGSGNGAVAYTVGANPGSALRNGDITIAGQVVMVTQAATVCSYALSPTSQGFTAVGGGSTVQVQAPDGCAWLASTGDNWIQIPGATSGSGNGTVAYTVGANPGSASRSGGISIADRFLPVNQGGAACTYSLPPMAQSFTASAGSATIQVQAPDGCAWSASTGDNWMQITGPASGSGDGTVAYTVGANPGSTSRSGGISIAGQVVAITQGGAACNYTLSPTGQNFTASGGSATIQVQAPDGCAWSASASVTWIEITGNANGSGNGTVAYTVGANPGSSPRNGGVIVADQFLPVDQAGTACSYTLTPASLNFAAGGGSATVQVQAPDGCSWSASASVTWIEIAGNANGSGSGTVAYTLGTNPGSTSRSGGISIAEQFLTVTQAGTPAKELYFGHWVVGGEISTIFTLFNTGDSSLEGSLSVFTSNGNVYQAYFFEMQPGQSIRFRLPDGGEAMQVGWALAESVVGIEGYISFEIRSAGRLQSKVSLTRSQHGRKLMVPVSVTREANVGIAVANGGDSPVSVRLRLLSAEGQEVAIVSEDPLLGALAAKGHVAALITELFSDFSGFADFEGVVILEVVGAGRISVTALTLQEGVLSGLPVTVIE